MPSVRLKPSAKSSKSAGRRHHHGMRGAGIGKRDRRLLRHHAARRQAVPPSRRARREIWVTGGRAATRYSAASSRPAMRRLWRASALYSFCQSVGPLDGPTCTAVTLYSGQLVAQSEKSVVMTLACVFGMVEGRVDDARRHALGDQRPQRRLAGAALDAHPVAVADAALLGVVRVDLQPVLLVPDDILGAPRLRADIVLAEDAAGGEQQREARAGLLVGRHIFGADELALAAHEAADMHDRRAERRLLVARPLHRTFAVEQVVGDEGEARRRLGDLVHDLGRMRVVPGEPHRPGRASASPPSRRARSSAPSPCAPC